MEVHRAQFPSVGVAASSLPSVRVDSPGRRAVDIVVGGLLLAAAAPVIAGLGVVVRLESPGPVVYRQLRVGRRGKLFTIYKMRSMVQGAERNGLVSAASDPRITRVGAALRHSKLDELPQLWNVVRGDMTLVGPRPEVPRFVREYRDDELSVLEVRPGITGIGQVIFSAVQASELDGCADPEALYLLHQMRPKLAVELAYLRERSWRTDLHLLAQTVRLVLGRPAGGGHPAESTAQHVRR